MNDLSQVRSGGRPLLKGARGILILLLSFVWAPWSSAQSVWDGGGADNDWTTGQNWTSNNAPASNSTTAIQFAGVTRLTPFVDVDYTVNTITFNAGAGAFDVFGGTLTIHTSVTNASANTQTISSGIIPGNNLAISTTSTGGLILDSFIGGNSFDITVNSAAATTITMNGLVTTSGDLIKNGAGTLVLSLPNSLGGVTLNAGTLEMGDADSLGAAAVTVGGNSTLKFGDAFLDDVDNNISIGGGNTLTVDVNNVNNEMSGVISGAGALAFFSSSGVNAPILTLSGQNTYTGGTTIGNGIAGNLARVVITGDANLGDSAGTLTMNEGQLRAANSVSTSRSIIMTDTGYFMTDAGSVLTLNGVISGAGAGGIVFGGSTIDLGTGVITNHDGTVALGGANTFTTDIFLAQGTLQISADNNLGNAANDIFFNAASSVGDNTTTTLSVTNTMTLGAGRAIDISQTAGDTAVFQIATGATVTVNGIISGTADGTLQKTGAGTLVLAGVNTYTGSTLISAGTLQLGAAGVIDDANAVTVSSGATFDLNGNNETIGSIAGAGNITLGAGTLTTGGDNSDQTFSGIISGTGGLTKNGTGTQVLSGANTFDGAVLINAGAINIQNAAALGSVVGGTTVANGAALQLQGGITVGTETLTINGTGGGSGALRSISGDNTWAGNFTLGSASTIGTDAGSFTVSGNIGGAFGLTVTGAGNTTISGVIGTGANTFTKTGAGTVTLTGVNTFSGQVDIQEGILTINTVSNGGVASSLGASAAGVPILLGAAGSQGTLNYTGGVGATDRTFTVNGAGGGRIENNGTGLLTLNGAIANGGNPFALGGTANINMAAAISGAGAVTKDGTGTVIFSAAQTYTGATLINAGTLQLGAANVIDNGSAMTIASGATFDLNNFSETVGSLAGSGSVQLGIATLNAGADNTSTTFSGVISGTGNLGKVGTGTMTLSGSNTYTGNTQVSAGVILVRSSGALGTTAGGTAVIAGAALQLAGGISIGAEALSLDGTGVAADGALRSVSGSNTYGGAITLATPARINTDAGTLTLSGNIGGANALTVGGAGDTTISGVIGTGANTLTKDGAGTLTLTGANTFSGAVAIQNGTVNINGIGNAGVANPLGQGAGVTLGAAGSTGILNYTGGVGATDKTFTTGGAGGGRINNNGGALTLNGLVTAADPFAFGGSGNTTLVGDLAGAGAITKDGAGTLTFDGVKTYTGATALNAGTVHFLVGATAAGSTFTVANGATLSGFGTVDVLNNNGTLSPGDPATLGTFTTVGAYTQGATGVFAPKIQSAVLHDQLVVGGAANLAGAFSPQQFGGFIPAVGSTVDDLITTGGGIVGMFNPGYITPTLRLDPFDDGGGNLDALVVRDLLNPALGLDSAQTGLATALTEAENSGVGGADLTTVLDAIAALTTTEAVKNAYDQILPRKLDTLSQGTINQTRIQNGNLTTRINNLRAGVYPRQAMLVDRTQMAWNYESGALYDVVGIPMEGNKRGWFDDIDTGKNWGIFANGSALFGQQDSDGPTQTGYEFTAVGATAGVDYRFTEDFIAGLALGYNNTETDVDNNGGTATIDSLSIGPYVTFEVGDFYCDAYAGYAHNSYDIERRINFGTVNRTATSDPNGHQVFSFIGLGYDRKLGDLITGPILSLQYTRLWIDSYTESGAGSLNLAVAEQEAESFQSGFGWHWAYQIKDPDYILLPNIAASYYHEFMNDPRGITAQIAGGSSFTTTTSNPTRDFVRLGAGITALVLEDVTLNVGYNAQVLDRDYFEQGVTGGVRVGF